MSRSRGGAHAAPKHSAKKDIRGGKASSHQAAEYCEEPYYDYEEPRPQPRRKAVPRQEVYEEPCEEPYGDEYGGPYPEKKLPLALRILFGILLTALVCFMPMYSVYLNNVGYLSFGDILKSVLISGACGLALYAILAAITRKTGFAALFTFAIMLLVLNFSGLHDFTAKILGKGGANIGALALLVVLLTGVFFLLRLFRRSSSVLDVFSLILTIMMIFFLGMNTLRALPSIRSAAEKEQLRAEQAAAEALAAEEAARQAAEAGNEPVPTRPPADDDEGTMEAVQAEMENKKEELMELDLSYGTPNLYFFIFDELGSFAEIEKYYGLDTTEYKEFLEANHVNYSLTSHSTSWHTKDSISAMLTTVKPEGQKYGYYDFGKDNLVRQALESHGYRLFRLNEVNKVFCNVDSLFTSLNSGKVTARTEDGLTTEDIAYENSILRLFLDNKKATPVAASGELLTTEEILACEGFNRQAQIYKFWIQSILSYFDYFENPENYIPNAGLGFLTYACPTHVPFMFQANGEIHTDNAQQRNWRDPEVYTGAYQFTWTHIQRIISTIIENDPDSIILIMSDHGVRNHQDVTLAMPFTVEEEDLTNNTSLLYYRGVELDIEGLSTTDMIRLLMNLVGEPVKLEGSKTLSDVIPDNVVLRFGDTVLGEESPAEGIPAEEAPAGDENAA